MLGGYWISSQLESRKRKHESEIEYRKEIKKHMDDIIKPLFIHLQNLWGSLAILETSMRHKSSVVRGKTFNDLLLETRTANQTLQKFVHSQYYEMSLLLPSPFPWVFAPFDELVEWKIIEPISQGKRPTDDITLAVNTAMKIQEELRRLVGFETSIDVKSIYPFKKSYPRKKDTGKEKVKFSDKRKKWLTKRAWFNCLRVSVALFVIVWLFEFAHTIVFSEVTSIWLKSLYLIGMAFFFSFILWLLALLSPEAMETVFRMMGFKEEVKKEKKGNDQNS